MITMFSVNRASHRITDKPRFKRRLFHLGVEFLFRSEWLFRLSILNQFNSPKKTLSAYVTYMRMLPKSFAEQP